MPQLLFYGWQVGYRSIASTKLFQHYFPLSLKQAHAKAHALLAEESFVLPVETDEEAQEVRAQFQAIGALCRVVEPAG